MKKGRSSTSSTSRRLGLPRKAILKKRTHFKNLFEGRGPVYRSSHLTLRFWLQPCTHIECKMGFVVPKRLGIAVRRNRMKRLLRETYRIHQHSLGDSLQAASVSFYGALIAQRLDMHFEDLEQEVITLLTKVDDYIHSTFDA